MARFAFRLSLYAFGVLDSQKLTLHSVPRCVFSVILLIALFSSAPAQTTPVFRGDSQGNLQAASFSTILGAVSDEKRAFTGSMTSLVAYSPTSGSATTPSYTTQYANDEAINVYAYLGNSTFTGPSGSGISNIITMTPTMNDYSVFAYQQAIASQGGTAGDLTATLGTNSAWVAVTMPTITNGTFTVRGSAKTQQGSGNTNTVTLSGAPSSGDLVLACIAFKNSSLNAITPPSGGTNFQTYKMASVANGTMQLNCYLKVAGASEGTSYVFTQSPTITTASTAFIIDYYNVTQPDELFTSSSASFVGGDVGKDFCVGGNYPMIGTVTTSDSTVTYSHEFLFREFQSSLDGVPITINGSVYTVSTVTSATVLTTTTSVGTNASPVSFQILGSPQSCGTISSQPSGTTLQGWGIWATSFANSHMEYAYGTDNTSVLQTAVNNLTNGGTLWLPMGGMMFDGYGRTCLSFPAAGMGSGTSLPINIRGQGAADTRFEAGGDPSLDSIAVGSRLTFANTNAQCATGLPFTTGPQASNHLEDFTIWGGVGTNGDGGGFGATTVGIGFNPGSYPILENVRVGNFAGDGILCVQCWYMKLDTDYVFFNGGDGFHLSSTAATDHQNITLINNTIDSNYGYGIEVGGPEVWGLYLEGNSISRNDVYPGVAEMLIDSGTPVDGCQFATNYWEQDSNSNIGLISNASLLPCLSKAGWAPQSYVFGGTGIFTSVPNACPTVTTGGTGAGTSCNLNLGSSAPFVVSVGSGTIPNPIVLTTSLTAANGWAGTCFDSSSSANGGYYIRVLGTSTTTISIKGWNTAGTATAINAGDALLCQIDNF